MSVKCSLIVATVKSRFYSGCGIRTMGTVDHQGKRLGAEINSFSNTKVVIKCIVLAIGCW